MIYEVQVVHPDTGVESWVPIEADSAEQAKLKASASGGVIGVARAVKSTTGSPLVGVPQSREHHTASPSGSSKRSDLLIAGGIAFCLVLVVVLGLVTLSRPDASRLESELTGIPRDKLLAAKSKALAWPARPSRHQYVRVTYDRFEDLSVASVTLERRVGIIELVQVWRGNAPHPSEAEAAIRVNALASSDGWSAAIIFLADGARYQTYQGKFGGLNLALTDALAISRAKSVSVRTAGGDFDMEPAHQAALQEFLGTIRP